MSQIKLDLKGFKHVSSDKKATTLQHPDGHYITLAHDALSPSSQAQLKALSKIGSQDATVNQHNESKSDKLAEGGNVKELYPEKAIARKQAARRISKSGAEDILHKPNSERNNGVSEAGSEVRHYQASPEDQAHDKSFKGGAYDLHRKVLSKLQKQPKADIQGFADGTPTGGVPQVDPAKAAGIDKGMSQGSGKSAWENLKYGLSHADGGEITDADETPIPTSDELDKQHLDLLDKAKGLSNGKQPPKQYAEGTPDGGVPDALSPNPPSAAVQSPTIQDVTKINPQAAMDEALPPDIQRARDIYDSMVQMPGAEHLGLGKQNAARTFTGNGNKEPQDFNPDAMAKALEQQRQEAAAKIGADTAIAGKQQKDNAIRQAAGLPGAAPALPVTDVTSNTPQNTVNGTSMQAAASNQVQPQVPSQPPQQGGSQQVFNPGQGATPEETLNAANVNTLRGISTEMTARQKQAKAEEEALKTGLQAKEDVQSLFNKKYHELEQERENHIDDIKSGYIDPERYWKGDPITGEGGHSKLMAGIGMILAGFNPTNNPNAAINYLQHQLEQSIKVQERNLSSKDNLLAANLKQFGNLKDAVDMTRIMQADVVKMKLDHAAATAGSPLAAAAAQKSAGIWQDAYAPKQMQFGMRQAMLGMANEPSGDPNMDVARSAHMQALMKTSGMMEQAKDLEARTVPGIGVSKTVPVPQDIREKMLAKKDLDMMANDLLAYVKTHTNILPGTAEYNIAQQKAVALQQKWREGSLTGVFRQGEQPLLDKIVDEKNPANVFKNLNTIPKLNELIRNNHTTLNSLKQSVGLPVMQGVQQQAAPPQYSSQQALQWAQAHLNDPKLRSKALEILKYVGQ